MNASARIAVVLGASVLLAAAAACGDGTLSSEVKGGDAVGQSQTDVVAAAASLQATGPTSGIWVTGQARVTVEPDLVLLTVGVRTTGQTVALARAEAAGAMDAIIEAVMARGLSGQDVQTQSFSIWPQYEYAEVTSGEVTTSREVLVGYTVNNTARIKIRDVDAVGEIIDDVAAAGGDATRISDIDFSIEDPKPFMSQLREDAVKDALARAEHLAGLTGVAVGELVFIGEVGAGAPLTGDFGYEVLTEVAAFDQATSISGGELRLSLNVRAAFSIR
ncbi:MAG: SIMPL domain-containing protein [Dehalococcoidia bacterium]|nr:SIMPL domain-containing protein [Dehalococcoidia bacterium]